MRGRQVKEQPNPNRYPNGQTTTFSYFGTTNDERLQTIWNKDSTNGTLSKFDYSYDAEGQIQTWEQQLGMVSTNTYTLAYDRIDQLLGATLKITGTMNLLKQFVYGYNKAGNRTSEQLNMSSANAQHNELNQLTNRLATGLIEFKGHVSETSTVMVAGSLATMTTPTNFVASVNTVVGTNTVKIVATDYSTNHTTNTYTLVVTNNLEAKTLRYDLNGNLTDAVTATTTNTYDWNAMNRLVRITQVLTNAQLVSEFTYDGAGQRVAILEKSNNVAISTNRYVWSGTSLCEERDWSGVVVTKRFYGQGEQIGGENYYYTMDHLGSIREMIDTNNVVVARYDYDPYGRRTKHSGDLEADFGFTGHYRHQISGLSLTLFRAYEPDAGQWLSRDPIGESGGLNLYAYAGNDPINLIDLLGLKPGDCYKEKDKAAAAALQDIENLPPKSPNGNDIKNGHNWEFAGYIYQNPDKTFSYTEPKSGSTDHSSNPFTDNLHTPVMTYHNHPRDVRGNIDQPSQHDKEVARDGWQVGGVKYPAVSAAISTPPIDPDAPIPVLLLEYNPNESITPKWCTIQPRK